MSFRRLIIPIIFTAVLAAGTACSAGDFVLTLPAAADTTVREADEQDWSSDQIKELLSKETGEPDIEGSTWKRRKNPKTAMLCSLAFPGLGQVYNERPFKAAIALGVETYYIMNIVHNCRKADDYLQKRDSYPQYEQCGENTCINQDWKYNNAWYEEYKAKTIDWIWWTSAVILIVMLDAYVDAHLHDMQFRIESAQVEGGSGLAVVVDF